MAELSNIKQSIRAGLNEGLVIGLVYSAYVTILFLVQGSKPFDSLDVDVVSVVVVYLIAGLITGGLMGFVRPWARTLARRICVAPFVAFPAVLLMSITVNSGRPNAILPVAAFGAVFFGVLVVLFDAAK